MMMGQLGAKASVAPLRKAFRRLCIVAALHLGLFELGQQFAVHWRESTDELATMSLYAFTFVAFVWAVTPALGRINSGMIKLLGGTAATVALMAIVWTGDYFYSWHLRPNLGLYREPDWVQEHPGFQREMRRRIEANLWVDGKATRQNEPK